jgi:large subunit ribosomal protein L13
VASQSVTKGTGIGRVPISVGKVTSVRHECSQQNISGQKKNREHCVHIFDGSQMKTYNATKETINHNWYIVDASNKTLGRLASEIAKRLRGKHKPEYTPHVDTGDYIIVINANQVKVTGTKTKDKIYYTHSGYTGGIKSIAFDKLLAKHPERIIERAVKGMLPKNPLGRDMYRKLKVYAGTDHPHAAQQPKILDLMTES